MRPGFASRSVDALFPELLDRLATEDGFPLERLPFLAALAEGVLFERQRRVDLLLPLLCMSQLPHGLHLLCQPCSELILG